MANITEINSLFPITPNGIQFLEAYGLKPVKSYENVDLNLHKQLDFNITLELMFVAMTACFPNVKDWDNKGKHEWLEFLKCLVDKTKVIGVSLDETHRYLMSKMPEGMSFNVDTNELSFSLVTADIHKMYVFLNFLEEGYKFNETFNYKPEKFAFFNDWQEPLSFNTVNQNIAILNEKYLSAITKIHKTENITVYQNNNEFVFQIGNRVFIANQLTLSESKSLDNMEDTHINASNFFNENKAYALNYVKNSNYVYRMFEWMNKQITLMEASEEIEANFKKVEAELQALAEAAAKSNNVIAPTVSSNTESKTQV